MSTDRNQPAHALLAFYLEAGVDAVLSETAVDRFADTADVDSAPAGERPVDESPPRDRPAPDRPGPNGGATPAPVPLPPEGAVMAAREQAPNAKTLDELRTILHAFTGRALRATATRLVFADGHPRARVMFVGEAPGRDEGIER